MRKEINDDIESLMDWEDSPDFFSEMEQFLEKPWEYLKNVSYSDGTYFFTVNPQFVFFGYPTYLLQNTEQSLSHLVDNWIYDIDQDFDHIIILEDLDRSLAVLMVKLCWDIEDVVHLKLNSMSSGNDRDISQHAKSKLRQFNWADYRLYRHFQRKLNTAIAEIGHEKITDLAIQIIEASAKMSIEC